ncbi:hypothetical protein L596_029589 [Steinernema carpocapsae]|uniref:Zinc carboxypeptidase A 1 n=1 Tax=Steinernema carpocapsae TaxID=34508 RepID=A0A4U5LV32_STECR|nr:hypothetical protein L596_029589 [Steinernema carpocapsae]
MKPIGLLLLCVIVIEVQSRIYTVLRIKPSTQEQVDYLKTERHGDLKLDFWKEPSTVEEQVHVMVRDTQIDGFVKRLDARNITHEVMIDDVEKMIKKREEEADQRRSLKVLRDSPGDHVRFNKAQYHSYAEMVNYLHVLAAKYSDRVEVSTIGTTHESRKISLIKIGTRNRSNKPAIWVDGGIHAREWVSPAAVLYMISQLLEEYSSNQEIRNFVDNLDFYFVPLLNPDGYEFSRSSTDPEIRLWRKNRSPAVCHHFNSDLFSKPRKRCCRGVDLNRNYDWLFGEKDSSTNPCSEIYAGRSAFSEPETAAVRDFLTPRAFRFRAFLTFHSYSQIIMYPFGHAARTYPEDFQDLRNTGLRAAEALKEVYGTNYIVGTGADTLYPASGGAEDWAKGKLGIKYSYLFELRPEDNVWDGFLLAENQILPTARETWEAVKVIAKQALNGSRQQEHVAKVPMASKACVDLDAFCSSWAQSGTCYTWAVMRDRCPRVCGFC